MAKKTKGKPENESEIWGVREDPILRDDIFSASLEWLSFEYPPKFEAVRKNEDRDPWDHPKFNAECDALTERRRRKLQNISLNVDDDKLDDRGSSVA